MVPREAGTPATDTAPVATPAGGGGNPDQRLGDGREGPRGLRRGADRSLAGAHRSPDPPRRLLVAGLAIGIALGSKLTISGVAAAMAVGVVFIVPSKSRWKAFWVFVAGVAAVAGFWFLRNLIHAGNPLPWIRHIGPIDLPGPNRGLARPPRLHRRPLHLLQPRAPPLAHLLPQPDREPARSPLVPDPRRSGGRSDPGRLEAALARGATRGRPHDRAAIAYIFTPLTAAGPEGQPRAFGINLRYLVPGLALGLALLPLEPRLTPQRLRVPLLVGGLVALFFTSFYSDSHVAWAGDFASPAWAVLIGIVLIGAPIGLALLDAEASPLAGLAGAVLALAVQRSAGSATTTTSRTATTAPRTSVSSSTTRSAGPSRPQACASGSPAPAAPTTSTASTAMTSTTTSSTSAAICRRPISARSDLPRVPPGGQRRQLRLPGDDADARPQRPDHATPSPEARLGEERPGRPPSCTRAGSRFSGSTASSRQTGCGQGRTGATPPANRQDQPRKK